MKKISFELIFKELFESIGFERGLLITIKHLIQKPESVIDYYIENVVKLSPLKPKYLSPIKLLFLCCAIIAIGSYLAGVNLMIGEMEYTSNSTSLDEFDTFFDEQFTNILNLFYGKNIVFWQFVISIIPMTILSKLFFINQKKYNLASHFVISTYCITVVTIMGSILNLLIEKGGLNIWLNSLILIYYVYFYKRLFETSILNVFFKNLFMFLIYYTFFLLLIFLYLFIKLIILYL